MTKGQRMRQARKEAGLSQAELGQKLGVSGSMIGQYENDLRRPKYETTMRIADILGVDVNWLHVGCTLEQIDQDRKDYLDKRYTEAEAWAARKERLDSAYKKLNDSGQQKAIERVEELTEIPKYQRKDIPKDPPEET